MKLKMRLREAAVKLTVGSLCLADWAQGGAALLVEEVSRKPRAIVASPCLIGPSSCQNVSD